MPKYVLRFFFSPGGGVCLWSANDAARDRWDYPVDVRDLPLPENTWYRAEYLMAWYNTSIDWNYPPGPSPWGEVERSNFNRSAQALLALLRTELGDSFQINDESETADAA